MRIIGLVLFFVMVLIFCKKVEDRICWKGWGKEMILEILLIENFDKVFLKVYFEYEFVQDFINKLVVIGGENMVKYVEWFIDNDGMLIIQNKNKCNFLRNE